MEQATKEDIARIEVKIDELATLLRAGRFSLLDNQPMSVVNAIIGGPDAAIAENKRNRRKATMLKRGAEK